MGQKYTSELVPEGSDIIIDEENKLEYVKRIGQMKMKEEINEEIEAFIRGFHLIIPAEFLDIFSPSELQLLIAGVPTIDLAEIKKHASYIGYCVTSQIIIRLWDILEEFTQKELAAFVLFISGNSFFAWGIDLLIGSLKIPYGKYKERAFKFAKHWSSNSFPVGHTW